MAGQNCNDRSGISSYGNNPFTAVRISRGTAWRPLVRLFIKLQSKLVYLVDLLLGISYSILYLHASRSS
jgi:hypothetical protein